LERKVAKRAGNIISDTNRDIKRLVETVNGNGFINSPTIPVKPKYIGTKTAIVVRVPNIIGLE